MDCLIESGVNPYSFSTGILFEGTHVPADELSGTSKVRFRQQIKTESLY